MKITREIVDNGKLIVHLVYSDEELAKARERAEKLSAETQGK